jgi:hypothetical protein
MADRAPTAPLATGFFAASWMDDNHEGDWRETLFQ